MKLSADDRALIEQVIAPLVLGDGWTRVRCPLCVSRTGKEDRRGSLGVRASGVFNCFKCGAKGSVRVDGVRVAEPAPAEEFYLGPPEGFVPLPHASVLGTRAMDYLLGRGLPRKTILAAGLGACLSGYHFGRVIVPVTAPTSGEWLGWVGRAWTKSAEVPYLYPRGMDRATTLYNERALYVETDDPVLVVEGTLDALAVWPHGVAVLGKPSEPQIAKLARARRPVAVVLDGDALDEGWALAARLRFEGARAGFVRLPPKVDPDEVPRAELDAMARASIDAPL